MNINKIARVLFPLGFRLLNILMIVSLLISNVGIKPANALGTYTISGNAGVAGATLTYTGGSTLSNAVGDYSFTVNGDAAGLWSGTVTPSLTGYAFLPVSQTYTNIAGDQPNQNYTARPTIFTFASMGDAGAAAITFGVAANQIATLNPALVLFNGDLENNGFAAGEIDPMVSALKSANLFNNTFLVRGNGDDRVTGSAALWESYFETAPNIKTPPAFVVNKAALDSNSDNLVYSFDYGNAIFIGLDVPGDVGGSGGAQLLTNAQLAFLDARLTYAENAGLTHAFIFFHGPEYPVTSIHSTCSTRSDSGCTPPALMTILNNHPIVTATFHGHETVLGWVHMDGTRISSLTRSYEEFFSSPSGSSSYNQYVYPDRMDYFYPNMTGSDAGFATIKVDGPSFTYSIYKVGTTQPVWTHTFSKVNTPPTISDIPDQTTSEDTPIGPIPFTVGDAEANVNFLTVTASSSNTTLVPNGNIALGGSGANRTITITPAANQNGTTTITVSVNDGNVTVNDTFVLTVTAVNDPPVADPQSLSMTWNSSLNIVLTGRDVEASPLTYSIVDSPAHGSLSGSGANQVYTPSAGFSGTDSFTFKVNDGLLDSVPATVSIHVTAFTISGNAGVAGATLSYMDESARTVTADGSGLYSLQVPAGWSGTVTVSRPGYTFSPASITYSAVQADQLAQNYAASIIMLTISGNAGVAGAVLSYTDGTPRTVTADGSGLYSINVPYNWSGTVTPSLSGYGFRPATRTYASMTANQDAQDYITTTARVYYVDKTNPNCTDTGQVGSKALPFCTIGRGAYLATAGQIVQVLHGTYAESVIPTNTGAAGNPITFWADPGVTVTGTAPGTGFGAAFGLTTKSYIVIDGFTITNTWYKGIYVDASNHITITNNHVSNAGATSPTHPYEQGIYTRNTSYSTISGNITDHNTCIGIRVVGGDHNLISNNTSFENFSTIETDAAGIELTGSSYNTLINNITYSNEDSGINLYYWDTYSLGSTHNLVVGNLSYENGDHGIDNYQSPYNTLVGNTIQGNGTVGINFEGNTPATGSFGGTAVNNILSGNGFTPPSGSWGGNLRFDANSTAGAVTDYNLFNRQDAAVQIVWNNVSYTSLAAFRVVAPTQEMHGLEGDPLFVDPILSVRRQTGVPYVGLGLLGNYYIRPGSPAIDSANADAPGEPLTDIAGNTRVDDPATPNTGAGVRAYDDRGAYEYLPAGPSLPVVTTQAVTAITSTAATGNGNVAAVGLPNPSQHGVVWGLTANPTLLDNKTLDGPVSATGAFTSAITSLTPGTLYHVRAYATNDVGTAYGEDVTFTSFNVPVVTTQAVTNIAATSAIGNGSVTLLGVPNPTQHGVVWSTSANPTLVDSKTADGPISGTGAFTSAITNLTPGTLYHVRAYATNDAGTVYGEDVTFTSLILPVVTTQAVTNITTTTATGNGDVTFLGLPNPTQHGFVWSTAPNPTLADSQTADGLVSVTGAFSSGLSGLIPNTLYHVRAYVTNAAGTVYGEDVSFVTLLLPGVTTQAVTNITTTTATANGSITALGSSNPTQHGAVWGASLNPTLADSKTTDGPVSATGAFTSAIVGLTPGATYHVRAYATNDAGTAYGEDVVFTAYIAPTVTTQAVTAIAGIAVTGNGTIVSLGVPNPIQYGVVWDTAANPTIALSTKTAQGTASLTGAFTSSITGLSYGMTYHIRAYATNEVGTSYGEDVVFSTLPFASSTTTPASTARAGADVSGVGTVAWNNPGLITAADGSSAFVTLNKTTSHYLEGTDFGFAIPANAVINGIEVTIGRYESGIGPGNDVRDDVVSLLKAGALAGNNKAAASNEWPVALTPAVYGSNADLWGVTWTPAEINASGFGVALSADSNNARIAYVDTIQITVTYTEYVFSSTTSLSCGSGTPVAAYGSSLTCVATVTHGSGSFTPSGTISWTTDGSGSFTPGSCTLSGADGTAACAVTYTPGAVGSGSHLITAAYAGNGNFFSSSGSQAVAVNKLDASVTPDAASKTFGDPDPVLTGMLAGFLPADNITATYSRTPGETVEGSPYTISAALSPAGVLDNYNITYHTAAFTIHPVVVSYTLTLTSLGNGRITPTPYKPKYLEGDVVSLTAEADPGWTFIGWSDNVVAGQVTIHGDTIVRAIFSQDEYTLTVQAAGGTVARNPEKATYHYGDVVTLTATPDAGWSFSGWSSNVVDSNVTIAGNTSVSATFVPIEYQLTVNITGSGTVTKDPDKATYHIGDVVTLSAAPSAGWSFGGWSANVVDGKITIAGDTIVNASFTQNQYSLTIISGNGSVVKAPDQLTYHEGDIVQLTAAPNAGWVFAGWTGDLIRSDNPASITIHGNATVTANYNPVVNQAPFFTSTPVTSATQDAPYSYSITAADPDAGDPLTITAPAKPAWLTFTDLGGGAATLSGTPANAAVGAHPVKLRVSDGVHTVDQDFIITVANVNDPPLFTSVPVTSATQDVLYTYAVTTSDPDVGDTLTLSAPVLPAWLTFTDLGGGRATLTGTPASANVGVHNVTLRVSDGALSVDQVFTIDVGNVNHGPSFTSTPVTAATQGALYTYNITASDPDVGDILTLSAPTLPAWLTFTDLGAGAATLSGTPANSDVGDHVVVLQVSDGKELASQSFTIRVANVNDAPVLAQPSNQTSLKGAVVSLQLSATDIDAGDVLTYSVSGLPAGLSVDPAGGLISGTISADAGTYTVTASVADGHGGTDSRTFAWTVSEPLYTLTINKTGNGAVTLNPDKPAYIQGEVVQLTAVPDPGWAFGGWSANVVAGQVTIQGNTIVDAAFTQEEYTLAITITGSGTVTAVPFKATYHYGDIVTLTAAPEAGWRFDAWSANVTASQVTILGNTAVSAAFLQNEYALTVVKVGSGVVSADKSAPYHLGDVVTLTAAADPGWTFSAWSGACTADPCAVTMDADKTVTATFTQTVRRIAPVADFNGDGKSDIGVYRPSENVWYIQGMPFRMWGTTGDILVPGDYNGDLKTEIAIFRPSEGYWYIDGQAPVGWGAAGDIPVPGDYNGDGKTDIAVYRPSEGAWYIQGQPTFTIWGQPGDIPVPADYNGDGKTDIAVYQPGEYSLWWIQGQPTYTMWGTTGDIPVPADYNGDGKAEVAVYTPGEYSLWWIKGEPSFIMWGTSTDVPIPADYNGDGKAEVAVYTPGQYALWWIKGTSTYTMWGIQDDVPLSKTR